jgi:hypothetical protein
MVLDQSARFLTGRSRPAARPRELHAGPVVALLDDESYGDNSGAVYLKLTKVVPV